MTADTLTKCMDQLSLGDDAGGVARIALWVWLVLLYWVSYR